MKNLKEKRQQDRDYRKNLGDIYRARQREHFKKYFENHREQESDKYKTYQELQKLKKEGNMKFVGNTLFVKQVYSPNGKRMAILKSANNFYFKVREFVKAVGYSAFTANGKIGLAFDVQSSESKLCNGYHNGQSTYLVNFANVEEVLNRLIKIVNSVVNTNRAEEQKAQETQFESQRFMEWFNEKILPEFQEQRCQKELFEPFDNNNVGKEFWGRIVKKFSDEKSVKYWLDLLQDATVENFSDNILTLGYPEWNSSGIIFDNENEQFEKNVSKILGKEIKTKIVWYRNENETEEQKMFENDVAEETRTNESQPEVENNSAEKISLKLPVKVPVLTKDDLVDIADRADFVKETFDVNKKDALRAVVLLKSQEINRDLSPLLALLKTA